MLWELQRDGHGNLHVVSEHYIKENGYAANVNNEIEVGLDVMDSLGFNCESFAYTYGGKYWFTDFILSDEFSTLRGVTAKKDRMLSDLNDIYYDFDGSPEKFAFDFSELSLADSVEIFDALNRAEQEKSVIQIFGHSLTKSSKKIL